MAYATWEDVQARMSRELSVNERVICMTLLEDAAIMIDTYGREASEEKKEVVSCRMVIRALGDGETSEMPIGATQGSRSAMGYTESWTMGGGATTGELYLSKLEKQMLGHGNIIGSHSPLEDMIVKECT